DMLTSGGVWFYYPMLGWGVGVAAHAVKYYFPVDPSPRRERRKRRRDERRGREDVALDDGGSLLPPATARRARVAAGPEARLRVADERREGPDEEAHEEPGEARARRISS